MKHIRIVFPPSKSQKKTVVLGVSVLDCSQQRTFVPLAKFVSFLHTNFVIYFTEQHPLKSTNMIIHIWDIIASGLDMTPHDFSNKN